MASRTRAQSSRGDSGSTLGQAGVLAAAAMAGAAVGLAANYGRKMVVQGMAAASGDWAETLAAEHEAVLALFDKLEATGDEQTWIRAHTLTRIRNALGKHALEEENILYPALREANETRDADTLNAEHGYIKTFLYELDNMPKAGPVWLARAFELRDMLREHMRMEEDEVFPAFRARLTEEQNARLTAAMAREGMKLA